MACWKDEESGISWYYDDDFDLSTWKNQDQLDEGFRLPTVQEVLTLLDYDNPYPAIKDSCPFKHIKSVWSKHSYGNNLSFSIDLFTGQVYKSTKDNPRLLILIKE
jgi:hypothetical protein